MKAIKTKILATSLVALTCASFTVLPSRDEELRRVSEKQAIVSDDCFDTFLKNLKGINALMFIPDTKVTAGKELNLQAVSAKNDTVNLVDDYIQVVPLVSTSDLCASKNKVSFDNLKMVVFVEKQYAPKLTGLKICYAKKQSGEIQKLTGDYFKIGTKLNIVIDGSSTLLTQVEYKL
jgi:hypothetical protein